MRLNLYDAELNRIAIIGEQFVSCYWSEGYNTMGIFTLELQATSQYKEKVKPDCFVGRDDRPTLMVIKSVETVRGNIVATGKPVTRLLDDSVYIGKIAAGAEVAKTLETAYNNSTKIPLISFDVGNFTDTYNEEIENKTLLELHEILCQSADIGFRGVKDGKGIKIELYKPEQDVDLKFSELYGNLGNYNVVLSKENYKNYAIVLGTASDDTQIRVDVDKTEGGMRYEVLLSGESQEEGETLDAFKARLSALGTEELLKTTKTWECAFSPVSDDFGKRFDLGDILVVLLHEFGLRIQARVASFSQKEQSNSIETTVEVGEITVLR